MSDEPPIKTGPKWRKSRTLSADERQLWRKVVSDARPLSGGQIVAEPELMLSHSLASETSDEVDSIVRKKNISKPKPLSSIPRARRNSELLAAHQAPSVEPPPLSGLDRRTAQKLSRGQIEADARIDLHGLRQDEAEATLYRFVSRSRHEGLRCVLVITGKGESPFARHTLHSVHFHSGSDHSGILRSALPNWLSSTRFRTEVAGFQPAHPRHGGGGAFYIWLRKR
ncbi:MAG: Smr/MutS family protein [Parvibaculum sp.]|nr:Smr/MutS family protein [Parvibaculum sp.]